MTTTTTSTMLNGVNIEALSATIAAIQADPGLAEFRFRAANEWQDGSFSRTSVGGFYGCRDELGSDRVFTMEADEPPLLLGENRAANSAEHLLHALASCLTTAMVYHAGARGIRIEALESRLEGDIDLRGFLGIDPAVRKGYQAIRVTFRVRSAAPAEQLAELCEYSPMYDVISRSVPVSIRIEKF